MGQRMPSPYPPFKVSRMVTLGTPIQGTSEELQRRMFGVGDVKPIEIKEDFWKKNEKDAYDRGDK